MNVAPPLFETLTRMSLLHVPVLTPLYSGCSVDGFQPAGVQPGSFESLLMYDPSVTTICDGFFGLTAPDG